jgi:hypothetical protein
MTYSSASPQVVVPVIGFTASVGWSFRNAAASRPGTGEARLINGRETEDRSSPDVIEYLAIAFVALAVAFGPAIVSLL